MANQTQNRNASAPAREPNEWDIRKLGCLWKRKKKDSNESYLTGVLELAKLKALVATATEDIQLVGFSNKQKKEEKHPDVIIYLSEKRSDTPAARPANTRPAAPALPPTAPPPLEVPNDDLI